MDKTVRPNEPDVSSTRHRPFLQIAAPSTISQMADEAAQLSLETYLPQYAEKDAETDHEGLAKSTETQRFSRFFSL